MVPFGSAAPAITSTIAGHTPIGFTALPPALANIQDGKLRGLAVLAAKRTRDAVVSVRIRPGGVQVAPALSERAEQVTAPGIPADTDRISEPVDYLFNAGLLVEALESFTADTVTVHLTGAAHKPVLFTDTADGLRDPSAFRHLLMPRRHPDR